MSFGATRHIADIRADGFLQEGQGTIGLQSGSKSHLLGYRQYDE
jgi:hypothetical protein